MPNRFLINQCQIILKYDIIENSRIELRGIVLPVQVDALLGGGGGGGGAKGMLVPPLKLLGGGAWPPLPPPPPPPLPTPMKQALLNFKLVLLSTIQPTNEDFSQPT